VNAEGGKKEGGSRDVHQSFKFNAQPSSFPASRPLAFILLPLSFILFNSINATNSINSFNCIAMDNLEFETLTAEEFDEYLKKHVV
jgi:hypothetical protein